MTTDKAFRGVHPILPTLFTTDGAVDAESMARLVDDQVAAGVDGVAVLGFMGEALKFSSAERRQVLAASVEAAAGRIPVWVGIRSLGTAGCIEQVQEAEAGGASAVFVAPVAPQSDAALERHFREIAIAKQRALLAATGAQIGTFGGLGGRWVFEELTAGPLAS